MNIGFFSRFLKKLNNQLDMIKYIDRVVYNHIAKLSGEKYW